MLGLVNSFSFYLCQGIDVYSLMVCYKSSVHSFRQIILIFFFWSFYCQWPQLIIFWALKVKGQGKKKKISKLLASGKTLNNQNSAKSRPICFKHNIQSV